MKRQKATNISSFELAVMRSRLAKIHDGHIEMLRRSAQCGIETGRMAKFEAYSRAITEGKAMREAFIDRAAEILRRDQTKRPVVYLEYAPGHSLIVAQYAAYLGLRQRTDRYLPLMPPESGLYQVYRQRKPQGEQNFGALCPWKKR
jgi:hypothetical protein